MDADKTLASARVALGLAEELLARGQARPGPVLAAEWVPVTKYATHHSVNRKTVGKWMRAGLVEYYRAVVPGCRKPVIRVRNMPPRSSSEEKTAEASPRQSVIDATA